MEMWGLEGTGEGLDSDLVEGSWVPFWFLLVSKQSLVSGLLLPLPHV